MSDRQDVIHGLKVWVSDGSVSYVKSYLDDDGDFHDAKMQSAGVEQKDWPLFWFLMSRDQSDLWEVLMGITPPQAGWWFLEFPIEKAE